MAKTSRKSQARFAGGGGGGGGHTLHADVNAARNLEGGRSAFDRTARLTKAESLQATVHRHLERYATRDRVIPAKVRTSPYHRGLLCPALDAPLIRVRPPPVVADVSAG